MSGAGQDWSPATRAVRAGISRSQFEETSEALHLTSGYVYQSAAEAAAAFAGESDHHIYSRFSNPTVSMLADRLASLEGAAACFPTASGMSAMFAALLAVVSSGDRIVASRDLFGTCRQVLADILPRFGVHTEFVAGGDLEQWQAALQRPTAAVFFESVSNPMLGLVDVTAVSELAHAAGAVVVADNALASPALQNPTRLGADVVVYSTTKHIDGQGRTLGGAVLGTREFVEERVLPLVRTTGPTMSPFSAWVARKGLETLDLRVRHSSETALHLAQHLEQTPGVLGVRHPGLESHPQFELARRQLRAGGTLISFEVDGGREAAFATLDALQVFEISNNFGDTKSLATHPASTTHYRIGAAARAEMGITEGTIRLSVGLEDAADLQQDLVEAIATSNR